MIGVLVFVTVLIGLLAIPVTLTFQVAWPDASHNEAELGWAFGLVRKRMRPAAKEVTAVTQEGADDATEPASSRTGKSTNGLRALRQRDFRRRLLRFFGDIWHAVHKENVRLRLRIGLGDPADTGELWAYLGPLAGVLSTVRDISIRLEPEFVEETLEFDGGGHVRVVPLQLLAHIAALLLSPVIWRGLHQARADRV